MNRAKLSQYFARRRSIAATHATAYQWVVAIVVATLLAAVGFPAHANKGQVNIPLDVYEKLLKAAQSSDPAAPMGYAVGKADIQVSASEQGGQTSATVDATVQIHVFESKWVLIPILGSGAAIANATVNGSAVQLMPTPLGLAWSTNKPGKHTLRVSYRVDATRSAAGGSLAVAVPPAAATSLRANIPGADLDVAVIPSAGLKTTQNGQTTQITATLPTTTGVQISWRTTTNQDYTISRVDYDGVLQGQAIAVAGKFSVALQSGSAKIPLLPATTILKGVAINGKAATVLVEDDEFTTVVKGRGTHTITVSFQVPVAATDGPPSATFSIPEVPISRFELSLLGKKEVKVEPASRVEHRTQGNTTVATVFVPMTDEVTFRWTEAIPDAVKAEVRANAVVYHNAFAEEGVLHARAVVVYEITRGETNTISLHAPPGAQINRITASNDGVADWRVTPGGTDKPSTISVFLNRAVKGNFTVEVSYERLLGVDAVETNAIPLPLIRANNVHRQRGMVALLATKEFTLKPTEEKLVTKVGENQLPAFFRQGLDKIITHTYKYTEAAPTVVVQAHPPERKQGKFDASVDTLLSLTDVTLKGWARIEINVKSGSIEELKLELPKGVNFLSLSAPSLRTHKVNSEGETQNINVQFTQDMEGHIKLKAEYELILADQISDIQVPTLKVRGAEVEQGRIAVEALAAVEVQPGTVVQLSSLDIKELPEQLISKTSNPILLAYKYVQVDPPYMLSLKVTRHQVIDVQAATIDKAHYRTLYTHDGLAVTRAQFFVRNSRRQFLKVALPPDSTVWSTFVDGKPEKPALASSGKESKSESVLIKIINKTKGFNVDLIYATKTSKVGGLGTLDGQLPNPDIVVTNSTWDIFVPDDLSYRRPKSNMKLIAEAVSVTRSTMDAQVRGDAQNEGQQIVQPLRITVPTSGRQFTFEKLYANQSSDSAWFSLPYASKSGATLASLLSIIGTLLFWGCGFLLVTHRVKRRTLALSGCIAGVVLFLIPVGLLGQSGKPVAIVSILALAAIAIKWLLGFIADRRSEPEPEPTPIFSEPADPAEPGEAPTAPTFDEVIVQEDSPQVEDSPEDVSTDQLPQEPDNDTEPTAPPDQDSDADPNPE